MMYAQNMDKTIFSSHYPDIAFKNDILNNIVGGGFLFLGILLFILTFEMHPLTALKFFMLFVCGAIFVLWGIYQLIWRSKKMIYRPTGSIIKDYSLFFDNKYLNALINMFEKEAWEKGLILEACSTGQLRLDFLISLDKEFLAMQLFRYVGSLYIPITSMCYFVGDDASEIFGSLLAPHISLK